MFPIFSILKFFEMRPELEYGPAYFGGSRKADDLHFLSVLVT